jgi:predicted transcriptional regulator
MRLNKYDVRQKNSFQVSVVMGKIKKNLELFESEWVILQVVWELEPCAAPKVQEELQTKKGWAYTTVKTMMDRMGKKGLLKKQKIRNLYLYSSAVTQYQARRSEIMRMIKRSFDGTLISMIRFLIEYNELSEQEYKQLEQLLKNRKCSQSASRKRK